MPAKIFSITGNSCSGTTTLTKGLQNECGWFAGYSEGYLRASPYFRRFLVNPRKWAFHNQMFFVGEYMRSYRSATQHKRDEGDVVCFDFSIYELLVYSNAMERSGYLDKIEKQTILDIFTLLEMTITPPNLIIYLTAKVDVILDRLRNRQRLSEAGLTRDYVHALQVSFDEFVDSWSKCPILRIASDEVDFRDNPEFMRTIARTAHELVPVPTKNFI